MMSVYYVYVYIDPRDNLPFYVGKGKDDRYLSHLSETYKNTENKKKYAYIQELRNKSLEPIIRKLVEDISEVDAYNLEEKLIAKYGRMNIDDNGILTNICPNNRPPTFFGSQHHQYGKPIITSHTEETKRKISNSKKGKESWHKGKTKSEETRARMSVGQQNKIVTVETKTKLSIINTGINNPNYGTIWITDGNKNMKINKTESIPNGWLKGRTFKQGYKHVRD